MGTYFWIVDAALGERMDPDTLDCGVKHLNRWEYWDRRNEFARCVEWVLVTRRWNPEDTYLVSDMGHIIPITCDDYACPPARSTTPRADAKFIDRTYTFPDIASSVREEMVRRPLPIPVRAVLDCTARLEVTTVIDDNGAVLARRASDGICGPFLETSGPPVDGQAMSAYAGVLSDFTFYDGLYHWTSRSELPRLRVTLGVGMDRWQLMLTGWEGPAVTAEGGAEKIAVGDLTQLRRELPEALHELVVEIEITLADCLPQISKATRRAMALRDRAGPVDE